METKIILIDTYDKSFIENQIFQNKNVNLILDMRNLQISEKQLEAIFKFNNKENKNGTTFVVVKEDVNFDAFSREWNIVPTIEEAKDLISLDEIMRDLE
ncbi:MAG TPA: hypothetical protein ENK67_01245 [Flavobacteriia bacterium]|nr:hypothetical protein [Flavobacteriia bacterium]